MWHDSRDFYIILCIAYEETSKLRVIGMPQRRSYNRMSSQLVYMAIGGSNVGFSDSSHRRRTAYLKYIIERIVFVSRTWDCRWHTKEMRTIKKRRNRQQEK